MANLVGQYFENQRVVRLLGRSTLAEVYLTEGSFPGSQRVLKVLRVELSETEREYFILAARAITGLVHPHIIRVAEIGIVQQENRFPFLFMEYAPNGTLRQRHPIGSQLQLTTVLSYVRHIAEALHYAHLQELTHGDIRPENILLGSNNQVLVSDFSFALISSISSIKKIETSTTAYLAPEQIIGQPCPLSDEYALGVMVYEWLSGELPFSGSLSQIADQHLSAPPPPLRTKVPAISPAVEEVVLTALAKDPKSRFANLLAFANVLEQASQSARSYSSAPFSLTGPPDSSSPTLTDTPRGPSSLARNVRAAVVSRRPVVEKPGYSLSPTVADTPQGPSSLTRTVRAAVVGQRSAVGKPRSSTRRISRRAIIAALPVLVVAGGGIVTWLLTHREPSMSTTRSHTLLTYHGHASEVTAVAWSPNGKYIASGGNDSTIRVWNTTTGIDLLISHGHSGGVPAISWSPDSTRIASATAGPSVSGGPPASDNAVRVWNATTGKPIYIYHGHSSGITDVAWSPKGERIASSSTDYTVQVWDATTGNDPLIYRTRGWYIWTLAWSPDGKRLVSGGPDGTIQIWDAVTGHTFHALRGHSNGVEAVAWSPDGKYIASASDDYTVRLWNAATSKLVYTYRGHTSYVRAVAWSPDSHSIASGSSDKTVQVWDSATGRTSYTYHGHSGAVTTVAWSPDGHSIASGSQDGTVQLWQVR
jgi:eukaryotic-like serine/threonine-protein kinase